MLCTIAGSQRPLAEEVRLPAGGYVLATPLLPALERGLAVPVRVHIEIAGDRIAVSLATYGRSTAVPCEIGADRPALVTPLVLDHQLENGTIHVVEWTVRGGENALLDTLATDVLYSWSLLDFLDDAAVSRDGATLVLTGDVADGTRRTARFVPGDRALLPQALALVGSLEVSLRDLGHCVTGQLATIARRPSPSAAEADVLGAARFAHRLRQLRIAEEAGGPQAEAHRAEAAMLTFARSFLAGQESAPAAGDVREAAAEVLGPVNPDLARLAAGIDEELSLDLLGAVRFERRHAAARRAGNDEPFDRVLCRDVTLSTAGPAPQ